MLIESLVWLLTARHLIWLLVDLALVLLKKPCLLKFLPTPNLLPGHCCCPAVLIGHVAKLQGGERGRTACASVLFPQRPLSTKDG